MSLTIPDSIKEPFEQLPIGVLVSRITDAKQTMIGQDSPKWGIAVDLEGTEPEEFAGHQDTVNFIIGTDEDPGDLQNQVKPETFQAKGGRFERFANAAGLEIRGVPLELVLSDLKDHTVKGRTTASKDPAVFQFGTKKGQANPYAGRYRSRWSQWMRADEGPAPNVQTTLRELEAKENDGSGGQRPLTPGVLPGQMALPGMTSPPPPPSPPSRAPMPHGR